MWCAWAVYICVDAYLRVATGISWKIIRWTLHYSADMNYARLFIGWMEFAIMLILMGWTIWTFAKDPEEVKKKTLISLVGGTLLVTAISYVFGMLLVYRWMLIISALLDWLIKFLFMSSVVAIIRYKKNQKIKKQA